MKNSREEIRKRKHAEDENARVALSLRCNRPRQTLPTHHMICHQIPPQPVPVPVPVPGPGPVRTRRTRTQAKSGTITPPFPWATDHRATVHDLKYLVENQILTITGEVQCKRCERKFEIWFDLQEKFAQVWRFVAENNGTMHDRAPDVWMNPVLPTCSHCGQENSVKPVLADKKKSINWLFLFLGQILGCCKLEQLKYFCKHTDNHRTGAKDRVLYLTYVGLCKQLDPERWLDRTF